MQGGCITQRIGGYGRHSEAYKGGVGLTRGWWVDMLKTSSLNCTNQKAVITSLIATIVTAYSVLRASSISDASWKAPIFTPFIIPFVSIRNVPGQHGSS